MTTRLHPHASRLVLAGWLMTLGTPTLADEAPATTVLGEVAVTAPTNGPMAATSVFSSVDIVPAERLERQVAAQTWQLFNQVPGVQLTEFGQGAWSGKLSFRGFNGEGELNAVKLLIDGIPSNSNDGNMPYLDMVFPLELERMTVVRGTNDPRYGLHNIAGNVALDTRQGGDYNRARAGYGSFDSKQVQLAHGSEIGQFSQNYFVGWQKRAGWRDHAENDRRTLSGKWFLTPESVPMQVGLIGRYYEAEADEPGYLTRAETRADPHQSMARNATDGGERSLGQVSLHADGELTDTLSASAKLYNNSYKDERWVRFSAQANQQERVSEETHTGALGSLTWRPEVAAVHSLAIEGGASIEQQANESLRYTTVERRRTALTRNQEYDLSVSGGYVQAAVEPVRQLKLIPAWRVDQVEGSYTNRMTGVSYQVNDYGLINQPKFSAILTLHPDYSLYGNWGRTFQVGTGTAAYKVGQVEDLEPSINEGWEAGVKLRPLPWLQSRVALWEQVASNEARRKLNDPSNASEAIGETRRNGVDVEFAAEIGTAWRLWGGYSWQDSEILKADAATPASQGKEIDHVPHHLFSAGVDYRLGESWVLGLQGHGQSDYYVERTNSTEKFGDYLVFDASAQYSFDQRFSVDVQVKNLTDARYEYVWYDSDNRQTLHSAADGLGVFVTLDVKL